MLVQFSETPTRSTQIEEASLLLSINRDLRKGGRRAVVRIRIPNDLQATSQQPLRSTAKTKGKESRHAYIQQRMVGSFQDAVAEGHEAAPSATRSVKHCWLSGKQPRAVGLTRPLVGCTESPSAGTAMAMMLSKLAKLASTTMTNRESIAIVPGSRQTRRPSR